MMLGSKLTTAWDNSKQMNIVFIQQINMLPTPVPISYLQE